MLKSKTSFETKGIKCEAFFLSNPYACKYVHKANFSSISQTVIYYYVYRFPYEFRKQQRYFSTPYKHNKLYSQTLKSI